MYEWYCIEMSTAFKKAVSHYCWVRVLFNVITCDVVLFGTDTVAALDGTAQMKHSQHGENHHHTLQEQRQLKLFAYPAKQSHKYLI